MLYQSTSGKGQIDPGVQGTQLPDELVKKFNAIDVSEDTRNNYKKTLKKLNAVGNYITDEIEKKGLKEYQDSDLCKSLDNERTYQKAELAKYENIILGTMLNGKSVIAALKAQVDQE